MHATLAPSRSRSLGCTVESSKAKYTVASVHVASPPLDAAPALRHAPFTQSSSSAHSSFLLHGLPATHMPAVHVRPGPHSASVAHALHLPAWQTLPLHAASLLHSGWTQACALQRWPTGHSRSVLHWTQLPAEQTCLFLQSLSDLHPGFLDESPQLADANPNTRANVATRRAAPTAEDDRCMDWNLKAFGTLVNSA